MVHFLWCSSSSEASWTVEIARLCQCLNKFLVNWQHCNHLFSLLRRNHYPHQLRQMNLILLNSCFFYAFIPFYFWFDSLLLYSLSCLWSVYLDLLYIYSARYYKLLWLRPPASIHSVAQKIGWNDERTCSKLASPEISSNCSSCQTIIW